MGAPCSKQSSRTVSDGLEDRNDDASDSSSEDSSATSRTSPGSEQQRTNPRETPQTTDGRDGDVPHDRRSPNPMSVVVSAVPLRHDERQLHRQQRERDEKRRRQTTGGGSGEARDAASYQAMLTEALERARRHQTQRQQREGHTTTVLAVPPALSGPRVAADDGGDHAVDDVASPVGGPLGSGKIHGTTGCERTSSTDQSEGAGNPTSTATTTTTTTANCPPNSAMNEMAPVAGLHSASPGTSLSTSDDDDDDEMKRSASDVSPIETPNPNHRAPPRRPRRPNPPGWDGDERQSRSLCDSGYAAGAGSSSTCSDHHPRRADRPIGPDAFSATGSTPTISRDRPSGLREKSVASYSSYMTPSS